MKVINYFYKASNIDCVDHLEIDGVTRTQYMSQQFLNIFKHEIATIDTTVPTAVLYASGTSIHQAEVRDLSSITAVNSIPSSKAGMVIKDITAYMMHKFIGKLNNPDNIVYASINSNTCASSMYSLYEAEQLLNSRPDIEQVIVFAEERTSFNTIRIFTEHRINVKPSDGVACIVVTRGIGNITITDTKWEYHYNQNPFYSSSDGYKKIDNSDCDVVKTHGTGTPQNTEAESIAYKNKKLIEYKSSIGHSQGVSALLELCILLDDNTIHGNILCTASGLGGFYGSCKVCKNG